MAFETLSLDDKHALLIAVHANVLPNDDVSRGSFLWLWWLTAAAASTDNDAHIEAAKGDLLPDSAPDDGMLDRHGGLKGVVRQGPTPARKDAALRVFGTSLANVAAGLVLTSAAGLRYRIDTSTVVGPDGYVDCDVVAIDTGSATRLNKGEILTIFGAVPAGLQGDAELQLDLDEGGFDKEPEGAYRARILSRWKDPPRGGAAVDHEQWALEVTGWATAYCYPLRRGLGSVDLVALHGGTGTVRAPIAPEVAALQAIIDEKRPVAVKAFRVLQVTTNAVDVEVTIKPDGTAAHAFDWDDTLALTVTAWDPVLRKVTPSAPLFLAPGDRVAFKNPTIIVSGRERTVESVANDGTYFILEVDAVGDAPEVTGVIYAGGPLVAPARAAVIALFDTYGTANPLGKYGTWEGDCDPDAVGDAVRSTAGVRRATVIAPGALVTANDPAYPDDASVELLIPRRILVRAAH